MAHQEPVLIFCMNLPTFLYSKEFLHTHSCMYMHTHTLMNAHT